MSRGKMDEDADTRAIQAVVAEQFRSLEWTPGSDADWDLLAHGFLPGATLFPGARPVKAKTVGQFADRLKQLRAEGKLASFKETQLGCFVRRFGNVAVAMAGCEMIENGAGRTRDVSAFLLVKDNGVWRIAAQAWDVESPSQRIPEYLASAGS